MSDQQQESKADRLADSGDVHRGVVSDTETLSESVKQSKVQRVEEPEPQQKQDGYSTTNNSNGQDDGGDGDESINPNTNSSNGPMHCPPQAPIHFPYPQHPYPQQQPPPQMWNPMNNPMTQPSLLQFYEAQMRDHAAAYASAAAGAAWVSAQIAADMASASTTTSVPPVPSTLPIPMAPPPPYMTQPQSPPMFYDPPPPPESPYYHPYNNVNDNANVDVDSASYGHRRKRQQRMAPSSENKQQQSKAEPEQFKPEKRGTRRRRRIRNNDSDDTQQQQQQQQQQFNNNRRRNRKMALASSSSDGGYSKKKQRQPSDESLLGKTGISALYEYCDKRRMKPTFTANGDEGKQDFEYIVSVDGLEYGRGHAKSKNSAKQEASRKALQVLVPGVVFDEATGILKKLPQASVTVSSSNNREMEDLAPNLAKRLAIGHTEDDKVDNDASENDTRSEIKTKRHKFAQVYPGTSTTASDEDNDNFYASRGASVCSSLLHVMVQIDERIPEAPTYTYQVDPIPASNTQFKRKAGGPFSFGTPVVIHRGSFTCTATLRVQIKPVEPNSPSFEILQTSGVGGTKREAKHTASAKLLAKLFPECEGMAAVKQAAEAAREKYAAGRALKQQSKRARVFTDATSQTNRHDKVQPDLSFALGSSSCPALPLQVEDHILSALGAARSNKEQQESSTESDGKEANLARQYSRQQQLDDSITSALQKLNEHDEDGRCLPDELTVDDVGRTVLRRATQEDWHWITKLLGTNETAIFPVSSLGNAKESIQDVSGNDYSSLAVRLWSSSTIVLLLCRAIAPYEDPPLGCAVLTLGFSLEKGRTLRIAQIASKSHLPLERFTEVLQSFATNMMCSLEASSSIPPSYTKMERDDIDLILKSHLSSIPPHFLSGKDSCSLECKEPLMSVREETEHEDSDSSPESLKKAGDKPSKRSRVQ